MQSPYDFCWKDGDGVYVMVVENSTECLREKCDGCAQPFEEDFCEPTGFVEAHDGDAILCADCVADCTDCGEMVCTAGYVLSDIYDDGGCLPVDPHDYRRGRDYVCIGCYEDRWTTCNYCECEVKYEEAMTFRIPVGLAPTSGGMGDEEEWPIPGDDDSDDDDDMVALREWMARDDVRCEGAIYCDDGCSSEVARDLWRSIPVETLTSIRDMEAELADEPSEYQALMNPIWINAAESELRRMAR